MAGSQQGYREPRLEAAISRGTVVYEAARRTEQDGSRVTQDQKAGYLHGGRRRRRLICNREPIIITEDTAWAVSCCLWRQPGRSRDDAHPHAPPLAGAGRDDVDRLTGRHISRYRNEAGGAGLSDAMVDFIAGGRNTLGGGGNPFATGISSVANDGIILGGPDICTADDFAVLRNDGATGAILAA
jgi:hypothetical protein